jgi:hypothetical protein
MKKDEMKNIAPILSALKLKPEAFILPDGALNEVEISVLSELLESKLKSKIGSINPFKVKESYFENFEDAINQSLENINTKSIKSTLKVPDYYFENLEEKVLLKIKNNTKNKEVRIISLRSRIIKISATIAVAASLTLFFIFNQQQTDDISFDSLALSEIEEWINQDQLDLDAYQIASVYTETKLQSNILNSTINEDELEEFLKNENINELLYE